MGRIEELTNKITEMEEKIAVTKEPKKLFKLPWRTRVTMKSGQKKPEHIVVQYLTRDYQVKFMVCRIISGNLIVVNNKVHVINPKTIFRFGKYNFYIFREIDRQPVSNEDYDKVIARKDDTEADVPLIKAVLGAVQKKSQLEGKKGWIIFGVIIVIAIIVAIFFFTSK